MTEPRAQTAAVLPSTGATANSRLEIKNDRPIPSPAQGELLVKLEFSGVCHSDVHSVRGETPMLTDVAGHEGVGKVVRDEGAWMGKRVGIRWLYSSCLECEICERNNTACPYQKNAGANVPGTFQQYIVSPAVHVTRIPEQLAPDEAAPLLCAGIAMYSSIMKTRTRPGDWLVLPGAGGGLGHMYVFDHHIGSAKHEVTWPHIASADTLTVRGVQIAVRKGLKVIAIDSGEKKKQLCIKLGATAFVDYKADDVQGAVKQLTAGLGAHAVICTANSEASYEQSMRLLRRLGVLVCVGIPNVPFRLPATPFDMIVKGLTIVGNLAGTAQEMNELMKMAVAGEVKAHIECFAFDQLDDVIQRLGRSEIEGRAVMRIPE